ncbi:capsular biosynthesis protein [Virgibacillus phasianinus]|uniref:Capsular biosynthesis protein n=1 Tax=Virgibacillus phasianinus TaxID=2017483 RepID=A0A220TZU3_9BACI|nr:CapA family protein [Virgibacillus phasianinus]ASK61275.1 capsular biosynthesis protein [Virgibacillus phasianinus]
MFRYRAGFLLLFCLCFLVTACTNDERNYQAKNTSGNETKIHEKSIDTDFLTTEVHEITLSAIGDMLIHETVYQDAFNGTTYNFNPMLDKVAPFLQQSTITMANQETMIGGTDIGLSTYPSFNSPKTMGDALKDAGIDVVTIANNHTLDRGESAILSAISYWDKIGMMYTGAFKSPKDQRKIRVMQTEEDISVAFLAYTYGTNGIPDPEGKEYLVNRIDKEKIASDIKKAKKLSDVIVLSLHFGNQYERMPSQEQKDLVQFAADHGVQVVIGHHPHVLQPVDWVEGENGNKTFVAYSLGNFLSGQDEFYNRIGGMVRFTIQKTVSEDDGTKIDIVSPKFMPTFVDYQHETEFEVIPMYQLTNKILPDAKKHYKEIKKHMSQWMPELEFIEKEN